jgi:DNA-binding response OmpR family regulator
MRGRKLLFVDDEPAIRLTLPVILKQEGFDVTSASTVPEALDFINKEKFDVLLSDLNIGQPGDGFTVVSAMRRTQPEAVTLILTGYPDFDTALQALRNQVDDYLTKPADIRYLIQAITQKLALPLRKEPLPLKRVSTVLRENAKQIMERWFDAVLQDHELSCLDVSRKERFNHMPVILAELADRVDSKRFEPEYQTRETARKHGRERREQGYAVSHIIAEAHILHSVISKTLNDHLLSIDLSTFLSDTMQVGECLHEQLEAAVRAFAGSIRILSIAYEPSLQSTRTLLLKQEGYEVTSVLGTAEARQTAETSSFDLFLIGHAAPVEERVELLSWLRSRFVMTRVLMLTAARRHEHDFPGADCVVDAGDPQCLLDAVRSCAPLTPRMQRIA